MAAGRKKGATKCVPSNCDIKKEWKKDEQRNPRQETKTLKSALEFRQREETF